MNDRINELKRNATLWCDDNIPEKFSEETGGYGGAWEDKFAELIVRECAQVASDPLAFTEAAYCHARVLKHFGVEE